jgi:hypothetical protein
LSFPISLGSGVQYECLAWARFSASRSWRSFASLTFLTLSPIYSKVRKLRPSLGGEKPNVPRKTIGTLTSSNLGSMHTSIFLILLYKLCATAIGTHLLSGPGFPVPSMRSHHRSSSSTRIRVFVVNGICLCSFQRDISLLKA